MVVHYAGVGAEMDVINDIATRRGLAVVEDNAHGLGGTYRNRPLGSLGLMSALSFHSTKNVQCGEGGALLLSDHGMLGRAEIVREKGTNRTQFRRGEVDKYTWLDIGSSYLPGEMLAAVLTAQLEHFEWIQERRQRVWHAYRTSLEEWAALHAVQTPAPPSYVEQPAHLYHLILPEPEHQQAFIKHLSARKIMAVTHYVPLHDSPAGQRLGRTGSPCPVTEAVSRRLVRLPLYPTMTDSDVDRVIEAVTTFIP
jgi:dTDP-4-amino-4,6-dideoxygalactose transaminase